VYTASYLRRLESANLFSMRTDSERSGNLTANTAAAATAAADNDEIIIILNHAFVIDFYIIMSTEKCHIFLERRDPFYITSMIKTH